MDKMKILMAASEAIPYMKTGGLADVVGSLPKYFDKDRYDVRVILPKYKCMDDKLLPAPVEIDIKMTDELKLWQ